jgi:Uncharacterized conserved protein
VTADRIERSITLKAPLARVWRAVSEASEFGRWFGVAFDGPFVEGKRLTGRIVPTTVDPEVAKMQKAHEGKPFEFVVDRIEPMRRISFRWHPFAIDPAVDYSAEPMTLVVFELADAGAARASPSPSRASTRSPPGDARRPLRRTKEAGPTRRASSRNTSRSRRTEGGGSATRVRIWTNEANRCRNGPCPPPSASPSPPAPSRPRIARVRAGAAADFLQHRRGVEALAREAMTLLGLRSRSTYHVWKEGEGGALSRDTLERISYVLGIYKALQMLLPSDEAADAWVRKPNGAPLFGGRSALERMLSGHVADLYEVRRYLDAQRGWN